MSVINYSMEITNLSSSLWLHEDSLSSQNKTFVDFYLHKASIAAVFTISYLFIFLICMVGNGIVCFIVLRSRNMRTVTNLFILNLAISDLLVGIFCMPTTLVDNIITGWPFGSVVCKLSGMVQGISVSASVFTLVAIAVDRFRCIVYPFKQKLTIATSKMIIAIIWVLAVFIMCPSGVMLQVTKEKNFLIVLGHNNSTRPFYWCRENWPNQEMRKIYTTVLFANIYLAPLSLIVIMYARIGFILFNTAIPPLRGSRIENENGSAKKKSSTDSRHTITRKKKRVIMMLLVVALLFILSWLPLWTLMMLSDYASLTEHQYRIINIYVYPFAHWLAFSNSSINPIIYGFFNENFRRGFQAAFKFQLCTGDMERQRSKSIRIHRNAVLPLQPPTGNKSETEMHDMTAMFGNGNCPFQNKKCLSVKSVQTNQDLIMENLEKVSQI
ncbi:neuropeptide FF receptor 2-like [Boleophthalmus pectinirostris]|uniref:neuropeptide FF receptor 2-like n=1 Tax=Boleophthalmus pectinirostris TaxID=150288 RepID=UPI000A1C723A|nr:neuropeptide FF receptor 2-like [Boleophthalmus pectinirostris]